MSSLRELIGKPVVSRASAETIGPLTGALLDASRAGIVAWQIGKGRKARLVDHAHVVGIGEAAVMIDEEASLRQPSTGAEKAAAKGGLDLLGHRALSDAGDDLGTVEDADVDVDAGTVVAVRTELTEAAGSAMRGFGTYALVLGGPETAGAPPVAGSAPET